MSRSQIDTGVPDGWVVEKLGNLCTFENGDRGRNYPTVRNTDGVGLPFVNAGDLQEGAVRIDGTDFISEESYNALGGGKFGPQDILFCLRGSLGKFAQVDDYIGAGAIASSLIIIRPRPALLHDQFLLAYLGSPQCAENIARWSGGAAQPNLGGAQLQQFGILCPPLPEQQRIAAALKDIDNLITSLNALIAKKRDIKQAAMQQLLTGKTRLPGFKGDWKSCRLGDVLRVRHGRDQKLIQQANGRFPILATGGEIGRTDTPLYSNPSVLIGRKGTIDKPQYMDKPFWTVDTLFYTEIQGKNSPLFLFYVFETIDWRSFNEASGVPSLSSKTIEGIFVHLPEPKEQDAIAETLADFDCEIEGLKQRAAKSRSLKDGMMQQLLAGRIRLV